MKIIQILPLKMAMRAGIVIGRIWYLLDSRHRLVATNNLRMVFHERSRTEIKKMALGTFEELGRTLIILCHLPNINRENIEELVSIDPEAIQNIQNTVDNEGVILVTAHFGAWELLPRIFYYFCNEKVNIIARPLDNQFVNELVNRFRTADGKIKLIPKKQAAKKVLKLLKAGEAVGILADQNVSLDEGIFVDFLGVPASTTTAPAIFAARTGAPVFPFYVYRDGPAHYCLQAGDEIQLQNSDNRNQDIQVNTQRITDSLTELVYRYPEQWYWIHRRWKNRPPL